MRSIQDRRKGLTPRTFSEEADLNTSISSPASGLSPYCPDRSDLPLRRFNNTWASDLPPSPSPAPAPSNQDPPRSIPRTLNTLANLHGQSRAKRASQSPTRADERRPYVQTEMETRAGNDGYESSDDVNEAWSDREEEYDHYAQRAQGVQRVEETKAKEEPKLINSSKPISVTRMTQIANDACSQTLGAATAYDHSKTGEWNSTIIVRTPSPTLYYHK